MSRVEQTPFAQRVRPALEELVHKLHPTASIVRVTALKPDASTSDQGSKASGYGSPLQIELQDKGGKRHGLVFHTATSNPFGHDRRADRAAEMLLAYDTFGHIPRQVPALAVGAIHKGGTSLIPLNDAGEFYLVTPYAEGRVYAEDLREVGDRGKATELDLQRAERLARWIAATGGAKQRGTVAYQRAVRDLVGSGEGIFGLIDGYPEAVPGASRARLERLEGRCQKWRWTLKRYEHRLTRIHGDYHPFNVLFDQGAEPKLLDASRGCLGDSADDLSCMSINYLFFGLERPNAWRDGFAQLWKRFWTTYLELTSDTEVTEVVAPYFAWRALVLANPVWYPKVSEETRDVLLAWVERLLEGRKFDPMAVDLAKLNQS